MNEVEVITGRQFDNAVARAVGTELRKHGKANSIATVNDMVGRAKFIVWVQTGGRSLGVKQGWREAVRQAAKAN